MKALAARLLSLALLGVACLLVQPAKVKAGQSMASGAVDQSTQTIVITRRNAIPSATGPADHFVGAVKLDMLAEPKVTGRTRVQSITFAPGAHTSWHSHPLGQLLVVTSGEGFIQQWGGPVQQFHSGDVIWTPPNVKHWHGAGPKSEMIHISVYEETSGQVTHWMEPVTEAQYSAAH